MKKYLKLLHMELDRFKYILAGLMGITALCQFGAVIWWSMNELSRREEMIKQYESSVVFSSYSFVDMISSTQILFFIPILLSIGVLVIYVFLIWYRDWFGRNAFIYRLLMLPGSRQHIYYAKATAILLFVFGLVSFQLAILPIEKLIFNMIIPSDIREPSHLLDIIGGNQALAMLIPENFDQFLLSYGLGMIAVLAIFTAILIERSYRRIGVLYAIVYLAVCSIATLFPIFIMEISNGSGYLYPNEIFIIEVLMCISVLCVSVWFGCRLLAKKITV
ncbi:hypothetical protein [Paenibacillus sp. CMAA1364]